MGLDFGGMESGQTQRSREIKFLPAVVCGTGTCVPSQKNWAGPSEGYIGLEGAIVKKGKLKMLKKILFGLVVLFVVGMPAFADDAGLVQNVGDVFDLKAHGWPVEFKAVDLQFQIPVKIDVGLYFQINNKKDVVNDGIKLKQRSIFVYTGCSRVINIQTNFTMTLGVKIAWTDAGLALKGDNTKLEVKMTTELQDCNVTVLADIADGSCVNKTLSACTEKRKVYVRLENPKIFEVDFGKDKVIANVTLTVKPSWEAHDWMDP